MNTASQKRLSKVHPLLAEQIRKLEQGLEIRSIEIEVVQGLRTFAEQDALYAQGRTKPGQRVTNARGGQSNHNYGLAVDVAPVNKGKIDWNDMGAFMAIGAEARSLGLEWGGDWKKFVDKPHVQLPSPPIATLRKLYDKGGFPEVWKAANSTKAKEPDDNEDIFKPPVNAAGFVEPVPEPKPEDTAKDTSTPAAPKPDNAAPQDVVLQPTISGDKTSTKSWWMTILALPGLALSWVATNIGEALGFLKDREITKWLIIIGGVIVALYLLRQIVGKIISEVGAILYNLKSMQYHADPTTNNVKIASPAPREDPKEGS